MKRIFILAICLLMAGGLYAQSHHQIKDLSLSFPDSLKHPNNAIVSFYWHTPNPETLDKSAFSLQIDGTPIKDFAFEIKKQRQNQPKKTILFLWEDMFSHNKQSEFTQKALLKFFQIAKLKPKDEFCIAVFNRCSGKPGEPAITQINYDFTSTRQEIVNAIQNYKFNKTSFSAHSIETDLYLAVDEGINLLNNQSTDGEKIIVLFTAGKNMMASGSRREIAPVQHNAIKSDIPIYVISYPCYGNSNDIESLSKNSYGLYTQAFSSNDKLTKVDEKATTAALTLYQWYRQMDTRSYGNDYYFSFSTTQLERDGRNHSLTLTESGVPYAHPISLPVPAKSFGVWIKEHLIWVILTGVLLVLVVVFLILLIHWKSKKLKKKGAADKAQLEGEIARSHEMIDDLQRQRFDEKRQAEEEAARKAAEEQFTLMKQLMQTKNLHPRLHCRTSDGDNFTFTIGSPSTSIGRHVDNDLQINDQTVSGHHAEITFNGREFNITNLSMSYTDGIVINGQLFQHCPLKNADIIQLGQTIIIFYI